MTGISRKTILFLSMVIWLAAAGQVVALDPGSFFDMTSESELKEGYYTLVDGDENVILKTSRIIHVGDEYIAADNKIYRVVRVEGYRAQARFLRTFTPKKVQAPSPATQVLGWYREIRSRWLSPVAEPVQQQGTRTIAIYHSHGAESYVPSDGEESIDEGGGILQVGDAFASALEKLGVQTIKSDETHVPHDAGAYQRSRRTKEELVKENPDALFDVHRDAVPADEYIEEVEGQERVQILMVVGRQNQNAGSNREFAQDLKETADNLYPNMVKGILLANGNYNQDMSPRSLLLEVGAHENTREGAEESAALFAEVVNHYLYETGEGQDFLAPGFGDEASRSALRSALWIIALLILGAGGFLVISAGGFHEAREKINQFRRKELGDILGSRKGNKPDDGGEEGDG